MPEKLPTLRQVLEPFVTKENLLGNGYHFELNLNDSPYTTIHHLDLKETSEEKYLLRIKSEVKTESDHINLKNKIQIAFETYCPNAFKFCKSIESTDKSYIFLVEIKCLPDKILDFVIGWADAIQFLIKKAEGINTGGVN